MKKLPFFQATWSRMYIPVDIVYFGLKHLGTCTMDRALTVSMFMCLVCAGAFIWYQNADEHRHVHAELGHVHAELRQFQRLQREASHGLALLDHSRIVLNTSIKQRWRHMLLAHHDIETKLMRIMNKSEFLEKKTLSEEALEYRVRKSISQRETEVREIERLNKALRSGRGGLLLHILEKHPSPQLDVCEYMTDSCDASDRCYPQPFCSNGAISFSMLLAEGCRPWNNYMHFGAGFLIEKSDPLCIHLGDASTNMRRYCGCGGARSRHEPFCNYSDPETGAILSRCENTTVAYRPQRNCSFSKQQALEAIAQHTGEGTRKPCPEAKVMLQHRSLKLLSVQAMVSLNPDVGCIRARRLESVYFMATKRDSAVVYFNGSAFNLCA